MKEALLYEKTGKGKIKCHLCAHFCNISPGSRGICAVRENVDGTLYSLVYGKVIANNRTSKYPSTQSSIKTFPVRT